MIRPLQELKFYSDYLGDVKSIVYDDELGTIALVERYTIDGVPIRRLFIGNIAQRTRYKDLTRLFSVFGKIDSCYLKRNSRNVCNYAFVTFHTIDDAAKARSFTVQRFFYLHNRALRVMPADSWHQPDSIYNQNKVQKASKLLDASFTNFIINDDAKIHKLNDDCLMHVFKFLPIIDRVKMERVCKRWRIISKQSWRMFKKLDVSESCWGFSSHNNCPRFLDTPTLRKVLLRCGQFLSCIDLSIFAEAFTQSTLTVIGKLCPNLQYIDVSALTVTSAGLKALIDNCQNIKEFSLGLSLGSCDAELSELFLKNKNLRYLKIMRNAISGKCLLYLPTESIKVIILENCDNIVPDFFEIAFIRYYKLQKLSLNNCVTLDGEVVKAIGLHLKDLKDLCLCNNYPGVSDNAILYIAELVNLETLNISRNYHVTDQLLIAIGAQCKQLKNLDISYCSRVTNEGLSAIISLPELQYLCINYLDSITDTVFTEMLNLRRIHCQRCTGLKNNGLCKLVKGSQRIELLDLSGCSDIDNELIEVALKATKNRSTNTILTMYVGKTRVNVNKIKKVSPFLQVLNIDLKEFDSQFCNSLNNLFK